MEWNVTYGRIRQISQWNLRLQHKEEANWQIGCPAPSLYHWLICIQVSLSLSLYLSFIDDGRYNDMHTPHGRDSSKLGCVCVCRQRSIGFRSSWTRSCPPQIESFAVWCFRRNEIRNSKRLFAIVINPFIAPRIRAHISKRTNPPSFPPLHLILITSILNSSLSIHLTLLMPTWN